MYNNDYTIKGVRVKLNFRRGGAFASCKAKEYFCDINPEDVKNVTVIRHAAIGDFVVMRPFLLELRKFFPNAKITLSVLRNVMYGMPEDLVDSIHIMDKVKTDGSGKKTSFFERVKQARELPEQDIIFDLTDSSMTLMLILLSKSKITVGYSYRALRRFFYDVSTLRSDFVLETQSMLNQLNILGANTQHYPLEYGLTTQKRDEENPFIIYFGGASMQNRCWSETNFVGLIKYMLEKYPNYQHVVLQGIKEDEKFENIYAPFADNPKVIHQPALPIEDIYDYLATASLVVVGDTGIRNMAIASNTPTLGIMWVDHISPLRYLPKVREHEVVFNTDFVPPSLNEVTTSAKKLMTYLYEK